MEKAEEFRVGSVASLRDSRQSPTSPGTAVPGFHIPPLGGCIGMALAPPLFREISSLTHSVPGYPLSPLRGCSSLAGAAF